MDGRDRSAGSVSSVEKPAVRPSDELRRLLHVRAQADRQSRGVYAVNKQRSLPPRNCTPGAKSSAFTLLVGEQWRNSSDIGHGFRRKRLACCEVLFVPRRTRVVGRKEASRSEAIVHLFEVRGARQYVVVRIKWVETEAIANAEFYPGARHDLHQAHCTARRDRMLVASAFNLHDGANPARRHGKRSDASAMNLANRSIDSGRDSDCARAAWLEENQSRDQAHVMARLPQ